MWLRVIASILIAASAPALAPAFSADPVSGEKVFKRCLVCHTVGEDAKPGVGPVLNGLLGRKAGTYPGFKYTEANKNSGLVWDEATLANYLKNPRAAIPGTNMTFIGIKKDEEIEDLIAYLKQFGPDGKPPP
jgi:cytochrome c